MQPSRKPKLDHIQVQPRQVVMEKVWCTPWEVGTAQRRGLVSLKMTPWVPTEVQQSLTAAAWGRAHWNAIPQNALSAGGL